ncbi:MAG TPA: hypothetical protein VFV67_26925 [Actinophytocola sp.]|uniref:hypothetical protein n=1 Tax=Actinophytocola sp. TaxID=1872138 RepID=UPI002DB7B5DF|nr:hypothetical protein [Actinophytocola sp.]HEU5474298.1 hypothetical protein [Actinophytocola sp.]
MKALIVLVAAGTLLTGAAAVPEAVATPARPAGVVGWAQIRFHYAPNDDIRFRFDAHAAAFTRPTPQAPSGLPTDARGTVHFSHRIGDTTFRVEAAVECLLTGGPSATVTALVTSTSHGQLPTGMRVGFSVLDADQDRMGFSWGLADGTDLRPCLAPAPFAPTVRGDFTVHHADAPLPR